MVAPRSSPAHPSPVFDSAHLALSLEQAVREAGSDPAARRTAVVAVLRDTLNEGRDKARALLDVERNGLACARRLSGLMDALVGALHDIAVRVLHPAVNPSASERLAVVAVGRLRPRHAGAGFRHRPAVPAALQADALVRERHRGHALRAVGPRS